MKQNIKIIEQKKEIDKQNLELLLEEFTGEYKEYFFDSAYLNLKIRDNIDAVIPEASPHPSPEGKGVNLLFIGKHIL